MRRSVISLCTVGILLWAGTAWAQGKGQGKGTAGRATERDPKVSEARDTPAAPAPAPGGQDKGGQPKRAAKTGRAAKEVEPGGPAPGPKGGSPPGKTTGETLEKGKGKGQQQQLQAFQKQLQHEQAKHLERQARLARIRELAVQKGDADTIARVDKLMLKEQEVYGRKLQQMQGQQRATPQPGAAVEQGATPPAEVKKPQGEPGAGQPKRAPAGEAGEAKEGRGQPAPEKAPAGAGGRAKRQKARARQEDSKQQ